MTPLDPERAFREGLREAISSALGIEAGAAPITYPPTADLGDLASPIAFELARVVRRPPREIAARLVESYRTGGGIARVEAAGAGYVNAYLDRDAFLRRMLAGDRARHESDAQPGKTVVEHTNINPNKAAHIGHLRNAVLGDTLVRLLRALGRPVEVQNYIDDTGVQVADLAVGFLVLRGESLDAVRERYDEARLRERGERFDYVAWDLYADVTRFYEEDASRLRHREEVLKAMEEGDNPTAELAALLAERMVGHHLTTMERIGVRYDLLPRESDILRLRFWEQAFARLREAGAIRLLDAGKNAGCWVMDLPGIEEGAGEDQKVIVRSNGTVTYVGKDIAYQMWKLGLLGRDFSYRPFVWEPREPLYALWTSCSEGGAGDHPDFGRATTVYNVIDVRQSYLQRVVTLALRCLGHAAEAERSIHYAYEMVALSPAAVRELFPDYPLRAEDLERPYLEMSGRRGLGVRADDLIDRLLARAADEVRRRHPELAPSEVASTARAIAVGALRYYMLRYSRSRVVAFDLDAALSFDGETGPYLQYSAVRARNILGKVAERFGADAVDAESLAGAVALDALDPVDVGDHWNLVLQLLRLPAVMRQAVESLELATVAKHAYTLAQAFNAFYHRFPVVQEPDPRARASRVGIVRAYHDGMVELLAHLGIETPARM